MLTKEFDYKGRKISYRTRGNGPLLVLLHGFGEDGSVWRKQFDIFPAHQLVIPDLPGSGQSEMIEDMTMEGLADAVKELIDHIQDGGRSNSLAVSPQSGERAVAGLPTGKVGMGPAAPVLIGHSMGGYVTLAFVEKYPDTVSAFGLFHSTAFADSGEKKEIRRKGIQFIQQHGAFEFLKTTTPNMFAPGTNASKKHLVEEQIETLRNFTGAALVRYYESMMERLDRTAVLRDSKVPVLFVMGRHDNAVPLEDALKQSHLPQLSYIHLLAASGHMGMLEEVDETNKILSQFMTSVVNIA